jgi:superoxide dismutase, Cu-Zn family
MPKRPLLVAAAAICALAATPVLAIDPPYSGTAVESLTATLLDTSGAPIGTVQLHQDAAGVVLVRIDAAGLPAGAHGVHLHAAGVCEGPGFTSAGGHFNPASKKHGLESPEGPHAGDLTQIPGSFTGTGTHTATTNRVSLTPGTTTIKDADGTTLIVHASADDQVTDPTGNSGARVACSVLAAPMPATPVAATPTRAPGPPNTGTGVADGGGARLPLALGTVMLVLAAGALAVRVPGRR